MTIVKDSGSGMRIERRRKLLWVEEAQRSGQIYPRITVGALPDDVLLEIFGFYLARPSPRYHAEDEWQTLVHVCKRWRFLVFAAPRGLKLELLCTNKRPVQDMLNIWPELPIVVEGLPGLSKPQDANNIITALKQHNRVCKIDLDKIPNAFLKKLGMKMKDPFPALTSLWLWTFNRNAPVLPDSFLGGSAPRLQTLIISGIQFPGLPKLLLSTRDLVELCLFNILPSGYISPEAMVTGLSALMRLEEFSLEFLFPRSRPDRENRLLPRPARIVLPALTRSYFRGDSEYLEDIVAQIDTPRLNMLEITFFNQLIFDTPLLHHFISRTEIVMLPHQASMAFNLEDVSFSLSRKDGNDDRGPSILSTSILCRSLDWQLSSLAQICGSALYPLPVVDRLELRSHAEDWQDDMEDTQCLEVLNLFTSVKDLVLHGSLIQLVTLALEDLTGERVTEVLPALQNIFLQGPQPSQSVKKPIRKFLAARQLSGRPVAALHRETEDQDYIRWAVGN